MPFSYHLQFWIMSGIFYSWTAPSFSIKRCANPASNWVLFIKRSSTKHLRNSIAAPEKQTISTVHVTLGSFGKLNRLSFSSQPKHTSLETFLPSEARAAIEACWLAALALVDACTGVFFWEKCPYKEFHRRLRHQEPRSKKLSETCTNPEVRFLAQKYSVIRPIFFFFTLSMLSMRIQLFTSVNNSECMKQHCTPPPFNYNPGL